MKDLHWGPNDDYSSVVQAPALRWFVWVVVCMLLVVGAGGGGGFVNKYRDASKHINA